MDFNKLIELIKELSGNQDVTLGDTRKDGQKIYIELDLVAPVNEDFEKPLSEV